MGAQSVVQRIKIQSRSDFFSWFFGNDSMIFWFVVVFLVAICPGSAVGLPELNLKEPQFLFTDFRTNLIVHRAPVFTSNKGQVDPIWKHVSNFSQFSLTSRFHLGISRIFPGRSGPNRIQFWSNFNSYWEALDSMLVPSWIDLVLPLM